MHCGAKVTKRDRDSRGGLVSQEESPQQPDPLLLWSQLVAFLSPLPCTGSSSWEELLMLTSYRNVEWFWACTGNWSWVYPGLNNDNGRDRLPCLPLLRSSSPAVPKIRLLCFVSVSYCTDWEGRLQHYSGIQPSLPQRGWCVSTGVVPIHVLFRYTLTEKEEIS